MSKYRKIDIRKVKTGSIHDRSSKVNTACMGQPTAPQGSFLDFWDGLPDVLASRNLKILVQRIVTAIQSEKPVLWLTGAHVIKTGLNSLLIQMMKQGAMQGLALNGAGVIHDVELAYFGETSEDVSAGIKDGSFGMVKETGEIVNGTVREGVHQQLGFGEALGKRIHEDNPAYRSYSLLAEAYDLEIPVTVHTALGTDIVHQHASADGAAIGELSLRDFHIFSNLTSLLNDGGVVLLFGSAVILPEVFLKALTVARNINGPISNFTTACFDMIYHYRPRVNVVERPTLESGEGFTFTGHHELMLPLLAAAVTEALSGKNLH